MTANGSGNVAFSPATLTATGATSLTSNGSTGVTVNGGTWNVAGGATMTANGTGGVSINGPINLLGNYTFQVANGTIALAGGVGSNTNRSGTLTFQRAVGGTGTLSLQGNIYASTLSIALPLTIAGATTLDTTTPVAIDLTGLGTS
jgi:hypothetical protein